MTELFKWPKNKYREMKIDEMSGWQQASAGVGWDEAQAADKKALEAYLGCSIEEAKAQIDTLHMLVKQVNDSFGRLEEEGVIGIND